MEQVIRVFIADASAESLGLLRAALEREKDFLVVGAAARGDHALRALEQGGVDLLITDLLLPGLDGLSLLRQLRAADCLPHTIVVSGFFNDRIARSVSMYADNFLPKPCRTEDLILHMRESVLGRGRTFVRAYDTVVSHLLIDCGLSPHLSGFSYLKDGILRILDDRSLLRGVTKSLYRDIARQFGTNSACVERSIRSSLARAWDRISPEQRHEVFGSLFDFYPEAPSNLPFLTVMTEYIENYYEGNRMHS